jgi:hypothetical protein
VQSGYRFYSQRVGTLTGRTGIEIAVVQNCMGVVSVSISLPNSHSSRMISGGLVTYNRLWELIGRVVYVSPMERQLLTACVLRILADHEFIPWPYSPITRKG